MDDDDDSLKKVLIQLSHLDLTGHIHNISPFMKAHGGFCDVFVGTATIPSKQYASRQETVKVAIKRLHVHMQTNADFAKASHPNILPLRGFVKEGGYPSIVANWMENDTVVKFLNENPDSNIRTMVLGIVRGVENLHVSDIVHSDLKADNVLVGQNGQPLICDFGISRIYNASIEFTETSTGVNKGSLRWMAPELLNTSKKADHTKASDVWAFGMLVLEILSRSVPYSHLKNDGQVMLAITKGELPSVSADLSNSSNLSRHLWSICTACWNREPERRCTISVIADVLDCITPELEPTGTLADVSTIDVEGPSGKNLIDSAFICKAGSDTDSSLDNEEDYYKLVRWTSRLTRRPESEVSTSSLHRYFPNHRRTSSQDYLATGFFSLTLCPLLSTFSNDMIYLDLRFPYTAAKKPLTESVWTTLRKDDLQQPACYPVLKHMRIVSHATGCEVLTINVLPKARHYVTVEDVLMNICYAFSLPTDPFIYETPMERDWKAYFKRCYAVKSDKAFKIPSNRKSRVDCLGENCVFGGLVHYESEQVWKMSVKAALRNVFRWKASYESPASSSSSSGWL